MIRLIILLAAPASISAAIVIGFILEWSFGVLFGEREKGEGEGEKRGEEREGREKKEKRMGVVDLYRGIFFFLYFVIFGWKKFIF